jgi:hypothetical protein
MNLEFNMTLFAFLILIGSIFAALGALVIVHQELIEENWRGWDNWAKLALWALVIASVFSFSSAIVQYQVTWDNACEAAGGYGKDSECLDRDTKVIRVRM